MPFWGTGRTNYGLKFDISEILTIMKNLVQSSCSASTLVQKNVFITDNLHNNALEAFRSGVGCNEELGFYTTKTINVPHMSFFPINKRIPDRKLAVSRLRLQDYHLKSCIVFSKVKPNFTVLKLPYESIHNSNCTCSSSESDPNSDSEK